MVILSNGNRAYTAARNRSMKKGKEGIRNYIVLGGEPARHSHVKPKIAKYTESESRKQLANTSLLSYMHLEGAFSEVNYSLQHTLKRPPACTISLFHVKIGNSGEL